jgi:hypothetical protein
LYGSDAAAKKIDQFLSKRSAKDLSYFNRHVRHVFRTNLQMHVARIWPNLEKQRIALGFFTFVDRSWVTNEAEYAVDLVEIKRKVRNALIGMNFIAAIEHAVYSNRPFRVDGVESRMLAIHVHAIVWTTSQRQLERRRSKVAQRFDKIFPGQKSTVRCEKRVGLNDFLDTIRYMSKMDLSTYRLLNEAGTKQVNAKTSLRSRYHRFNKMRDELLTHYWFAGGTGAPILRAAVRSLTNGGSFSRRDIRRFLQEHESGERQRRAKRMEKARQNGVRKQRGNRR